MLSSLTLVFPFEFWLSQPWQGLFLLSFLRFYLLLLYQGQYQFSWMIFTLVFQDHLQYQAFYLLIHFQVVGYYCSPYLKNRKKLNSELKMNKLD